MRVFDLPVCDFSGLEGEPDIEVVRGDITNSAHVEAAVAGAGGVLHLAALLPPASEADRSRTFAVNVDGTANIINAMQAAASDAVLVFSSSVSTYGDTTSDTPPLYGSSIPRRPWTSTPRARSPASAWCASAPCPRSCCASPGIAVPVLQEPPEVWPFTAEQRLEMVQRDDVVTALYKAIVTPAARDKTLNIAGGASWQTTGRQYVADLYDVIGVPMEMAAFRGNDEPGWVDWYDTEVVAAAARLPGALVSGLPRHAARGSRSPAGRRLLID